MGWTLYQGDCLEVLPTLADNSVDLIAVDPPYFKVKDDAWDRQWRAPAAFVEWVGRLCEQWQRMLRPNGSLYVFASPRMAGQVEQEIGRRFTVLNHIVWHKPVNRSQRASKEALRCYFPASERIIFAEHKGADRMAKGETGFEGECERVKGFTFEPLRAYLDGERQRAGVSPGQLEIYFAAHGWPRFATRHMFTRSQWAMPTKETYERVRQALHDLVGGEYLPREYAYLRRDYEYLHKDYTRLRRQYEHLRRPFGVTREMLYTDVWSMNAPASTNRLHPAQKPLAMMRQIVTASSRPGAVVLDCCMGSGTTGVAAVMEGREFIGVESDARYFEIAKGRIEAAQPG
jgi:site-specific DNA-methyltransferase (adenine-specific)